MHRALPAPAPSAQRAFHAFLLLGRSRLRRAKRVEGAFERRSGQLGAIHTGQRVPKSLAACVQAGPCSQGDGGEPESAAVPTASALRAKHIPEITFIVSNSHTRNARHASTVRLRTGACPTRLCAVDSRDPRDVHRLLCRGPFSAVLKTGKGIL